MAKELSNLKPVPGSTRPRMRVGRGEGSGKGRTAGRGQKGQLSRSGSGVRPGFEGGQMPLQRRIPKRGFNNVFAKDFSVVNIGEIGKRFEAGSVVDGEAMMAAGLISRMGRDGVKVLGRGEIPVALTVRATSFSKSAAEKIAAAGGSVEVI